MKSLIEIIKENLEPIKGQKSDFDSIVKMAKDKRFVLIGESTHGTKEFYKTRAEITKRLIEECGFSAVAIEGDWPDAYHVNRYVNHTNHNGNSTHALSQFERFPTWMWQNKEVLEFIKWLHGHNQNKKSVRFYGLDLYSMQSSIAAIISYLDKMNPEAGKRARERYSCLDDFSLQKVKLEIIGNSCEDEVIEQLLELRKNAFEYLKKDGFLAEEEFFCAEQNAILVKDAQQYYRSLFFGDELSWNLRDAHMAKTLDSLSHHLERINKAPAKIIVWAHNSHIGDAQNTEMSKRGEWNLGQLVREKYEDETLLIGFSTYSGTVSAAANWDEKVEKKNVLPALGDSIENLFHRTGEKNFLLRFLGNEELTKRLDKPILQRFIGVIYRPQTELQSHYYRANISRQFDALIYFDETSAVEPLKVTAEWHAGENHKELDETLSVGNVNLFGSGN
ncbi:MAG: erythromycin esterase family protein [Pseudomonadota bacterium]